jgi:hypothetical protein
MVEDVRHAELRQRLRAYADGTLAEPDAELVRAHLGTGCPECLAELFTRPVGLPRPPIILRRARGPIVAAVAAGAAALGLGAGALVATARGPRLDQATTVERLASEIQQLRADRTQADAAAHAHLERLESRMHDVLAPQPAPSAPPPAAAPSATPPATDAVPRWLAELLASPGARTIPLAAGSAAPDATGYAVWSPTRGIAMVAAAGLPGGHDEAVYRVRIAFNDGTVAWAGDFTASPDGSLVATVTGPPAERRRITDVELHRDPPGAVVLEGRATG